MNLSELSTDTIQNIEIESDKRWEDDRFNQLDSESGLLFDGSRNKLPSTSSLPSSIKTIEDHEILSGQDLVTKLKLRIVELELIVQEQQAMINELQLLE